MIITIEHCRSVVIGGKRGLCSYGVRQFMALHGVEWLDFVQHGVDSDDLPQNEFVKQILEQFDYGER